MAFFYRSAGACPPRSQHGEGLSLALREGAAFFYRSAGACPPRSQHGEGLSLALREGAAFFYRSAGACPPRSQHGEGQVFPPPYVKGQRFFTVAGTCHRDVERFMKHPQLG